jgi:hypothetical protein
MTTKSSEYIGNIVSVRAVEDSIRDTRKYTEGIGTIRKQHPIQGEEFPSRMFCKYYEVYPETKIDWDMPVGKAVHWMLMEVPMIDVMFQYDYRCNKATVIVKDGEEAVAKLIECIPMFGKRLSEVTAGGVAINENPKIVPDVVRQVS